MEPHGGGIGGVVGGTASTFLCWIIGMVNTAQFGEVILWAVIGAVVGWATQIILNKFFKQAFINLLNKIKLKFSKNGNSTGDMGKGHRR